MAVVTASPECRSESDTRHLIATLEEMVQVHHQLLSVLQAEKRIIIEGKVDQLVHCVGEKESVLMRLSHLEKERITFTQRLDQTHSSPTLKGLIPLVSSAYQKKLETLRNRLNVLTSSIQEINQMNGTLVERVLGQISDLFGLLQHLRTEEPTYQPTGEMMASSSGRTISRG